MSTPAKGLVVSPMDQWLREREELLAAIFEHAPIGIAITDVEARFITTNKRFQEILGYSAAELAKLSGWDVTYSEDHASNTTLRDELIEGKRSDYTWEKRYVTKRGDIVWARNTVTLMRDAAGKPAYLVALVEDVTKRHEADEALRKSERLLREANELGHTGSWEHNLVTGEIINTEENLRLFFGEDRTKGERFENYGEAIHPDDRDYVMKRHAQLLAEGGPREIEFRVIWPDGDVRTIYGLATVVRDAAGKAIRTYGTNLDVTERRRSEAALRATTEQLHALTRRLVELQEAERREISRELHDRVGQTLTAMRINMEIIRGRLAKHDDADIRSRNEDSLQLIESAFQTVENVMYELRPPMLDEYGLMAPLKWYAKKLADRTGIRIGVAGDEGARFRPEVELALFRIAQEGLTNVARHARASRVSVELAKSDAKAVLTIEDDGVGIGGVERPAKPGYGLISMRERAESVGGTFEVEAAPGGGTRLTVRAPG